MYAIRSYYGALTVSVVTKPFYFEAKTRMRNAETGWDRLKEFSDRITSYNVCYTKLLRIYAEKNGSNR